MTPTQYILYAAGSILLCICSYNLGCTVGRSEGQLNALLRLLDVVFGGGTDGEQ